MKITNVKLEEGLHLIVSKQTNVKKGNNKQMGSTRNTRKTKYLVAVRIDDPIKGIVQEIFSFDSIQDRRLFTEDLKQNNIEFAVATSKTFLKLMKGKPNES